MILIKTEYFTLSMDMAISFRNAPNLSDMVRYGMILPRRGKLKN